MKTIIIPAYCGSACVEQLNTALNFFEQDEITCVFLQIRPMPDNYNDMMTLHRNMGKYQFFDESFSHSVRQLKQKFNGRLSVVTDYIYGDSPAVFRNYVNHRAADMVIYDKKEWQDSKIKTGLNIFRMVSRCGCELMYVSRDVANTGNEVPAADSWSAKDTPDSVLYQYNAVDQQLNDLESVFNGHRVISKKINNLSRYFLNESLMQKMLVQSECSMLLLKK